MADAWGWNPVDWVVVPVKCAMVWAFVPQTDISAEAEDRMDGLADTGIGSWLLAPVEVGNQVSALGGVAPAGHGQVSTLAARREDFPFVAPAGEDDPSVAGISESMFPALRSGTAGPPAADAPMVLSAAGAAEYGAASWGAFGCQGPPLTVDLSFAGSGSRTIYPLSACESPMSTIAGLVRAGLAVLINATVILAIPRMAMSVMGFKKDAEASMNENGRTA
uniref:hypothetical protein n=1 Tax=Ornithinimicrobium sufpigmenti TaxID=2508882 RepID=UPI0037C8CD30